MKLGKLKARYCQNIKESKFQNLLNLTDCKYHLISGPCSKLFKTSSPRKFRAFDGKYSDKWVHSEKKSIKVSRNISFLDPRLKLYFLLLTGDDESSLGLGVN